VHDFLMSLLPWGTDAVLWVQGFRSPALDVFFKAVTFLGEEEFYLLIMPLIYWLVDKRLGARLAVGLLSGVCLNNWLKDLFYIPRPDPLRVARLVQETSYAFPSGHTQNSTVLFGFLAAQIRRRAGWAVGLILVATVALSRVYLGVHYPQDVMGGFLIGAIYLFLYLRLQGPAAGWLGRQRLAMRLAVALLLPIAVALIHPTEGAVVPLGTLTGFGVAYVLEAEWVRFQVDGLWWQRVLRYLVGVLVILIVYVGLKVVFPEGTTFRFLRYSCVGLSVGVVAPWLFVKTRLAAAARGGGSDR